MSSFAAQSESNREKATRGLKCKMIVIVLYQQDVISWIFHLNAATVIADA